ncbi:Mucin-associated surface protein (MASP) [Trypanosoma cruzi]|uniref:Mucin-associated surface protein (MASP) n=1 Tax=Trypanosoma cruzi TaxID=5693 RepID=A0A2V2UUE7_TRYCR|nr:Mucin-associated surface protein (MASP) [Trypanosoma cruzi]
MMTCRLLCALLVLVLYCCPSVTTLDVTGKGGPSPPLTQPQGQGPAINSSISNTHTNLELGTPAAQHQPVKADKGDAVGVPSAAQDESEGRSSGVKKENTGVQTAVGDALLGNKGNGEETPGRNEFGGSQEENKNKVEEVNESQEIQDMQLKEHKPAQATQQIQQQQNPQLPSVESYGGSPGGVSESLGSFSPDGASSSRNGGEKGQTGSNSTTTVEKVSKEDTVPEKIQSEKAQPHNAKAADALKNGPQHHISVPKTRTQNDNDVATSSANDLLSLGKQITVKGDPEASQTEELSADPNKKLKEGGNAPPESSQSAAPETTAQHEVLTSVKELTVSKSTSASANLPDAPKGSNGVPASTANKMQSTSTRSQEAAATLSSNGISSIQEETPTGNNSTENVQIPDAAETEKSQNRDTAKDGESNGSPTASPAGESDAATTTTPNNPDARSLNNNGNNTFTEELDQKEAARKPKSAPDSTDTAAANSEASTTAITISTNTTNKTTTGDIDGSTAVSHTTSPLLLLLLVACAAAAAVVAA